MEQEQQPVTPNERAEQQRYKTMGVRLDLDLHAQLSFIAQLTDSTLTDEIVRAIRARIDSAQSDPDLVARAEAVRGEIEREAQARQEAIAGFFGKNAVAGASGNGNARPSGPAKATQSRQR